MTRKAVFGLAAVTFGGYVVWVACLSAVPHEIERDVANRVTAILERTGFGSVIPVVDGRDVTLQGEVPSEAVAQRAERIVRSQRGVRDVRSELTLGPIDLPGVERGKP